jgi:hypothetical protein
VVKILPGKAVMLIEIERSSAGEADDVGVP